MRCFGRIFLLKQFTHALERERSVLSGREALHKSFYVERISPPGLPSHSTKINSRTDGCLFFISKVFSRVGSMVRDLIKTSSGRLKLFAVLGLPVLWGVALLIFINITSPLQSGPLSVLAVFTLGYLFITSVLYALTLSAYKIGRLFGWRKVVSSRQLYYLVSVIGFWPVFLLALNTLGQLEIKEVILVTLLISIGCFYVVRRGRNDT